MNLILDTYTTTTQPYKICYSKGHVNQLLVQSTTLFEFYYTKGDIDVLLACKIYNIGGVSLPGMLDIGTTYTNSRIRCNAEVGGHTGYAELKAAGSWDMFLNLQTTYPNGGWMYFKINNDSYMQLSASDNKLNRYKDTTISGNLDAQRITLNKPSNDNEIPLKIINNSQSWEVIAIKNTFAGDGCIQIVKTPQSPTVWNTGVWHQNQYGIRHGGEGLWMYDNGDTTISGNLVVGGSKSRCFFKR